MDEEGAEDFRRSTMADGEGADEAADGHVRARRSGSHRRRGRKRSGGAGGGSHLSVVGVVRGDDWIGTGIFHTI